MRKSFVIGDYRYSRGGTWVGTGNSYPSWAKDATKTFTFAGMTGYDRVTDEDEETLQVIISSYASSPTIGDEIYYFMRGVSKTYNSSNFTVTYGGASSVTIKAKKALTTIYVDYSEYLYVTGKVSAEADDRTKSSYADMPSTVTDEGTSNNVVSCSHAFENCVNLVTAPQIPNTVTSMVEAFKGCSALITASVIPSSVNYMMGAFDSCASLTGNIEVYNDSPSSDMFAGTQHDIFIIDKGSAFPANWKGVASHYTNIHFEADDNPPPAISNLTVTRVGSSGSTTYDQNGLYAYIQVRVMAYDDLIPLFWTNEIKSISMTIDGSPRLPTWAPAITDYPADIHCWEPLYDTAAHVVTLQVQDSVKDSGTEVRSQSSATLSKTVPKAYALVDYYHDEVTDTEGVAFGKYAEQADLFDVDMPALFRQSITAKDWAGFIQIFAGTTAPTGWKLCDGSEVAVADYPTLYSVIGTTYNDGTETSGYFRLPNLTGRFPIGKDSISYLLGDTGGSADAIVPYHRHSVSAVSNAITGGSHNHEIKYSNVTRGSGGTSTRMGPYSYTNTSYDGVYNKPNDHTHNLPAHNTNYVGTNGAEVGANIPPYLGINFIICTGETS